MSAPVEIVERVVVMADHPCLPGHFPGQPVVPGVVLLDRVAGCLERGGHGRLGRISAVKFLAPMLPGEVAELHLTVDRARVRFRITRGDVGILNGEGELA